tara:strand:- start:1745 stop:1999 length:255 start_codon:yes stop_codon:yes gene_type:complete
MSRIAILFAALKETGKKALIPYITAGDPQKEATVPMMHALVDAGCDLIELGVPFPIPWRMAPLFSWPVSGHWNTTPHCATCWPW